MDNAATYSVLRNMPVRTTGWDGPAACLPYYSKSSDFPERVFGSYLFYMPLAKLTIR
jgi:hypothetical protein